MCTQRAQEQLVKRNSFQISYTLSCRTFLETVICGPPGACVSLDPALCSFHSCGGEAVAFSPDHSLSGSGSQVFSFQGCGRAPCAPGTDASRLARDCDLGAGGRRSA